MGKATWSRMGFGSGKVVVRPRLRGLVTASGLRLGLTGETGNISSSRDSDLHT